MVKRNIQTKNQTLKLQ